MGRRSRFPKVKYRFFKNGWEIYWYWDFKRYTYAPGYSDRSLASLVEAEALRLGAAFADDTPALTPKWREAPGVRRYMAARYGEEWDSDQEPVCNASPSELLELYQKHLELHCVRLWAVNSMTVIKKLDAFVPGGFLKTTKQHADDFLQACIEAGLKPGTRNHYLNMCRKFFNWLIRRGSKRENPFAGIKKMKDVDVKDIVYCTKQERERILKVARKNREDWLAVAIAFYAGCRRREVFRLQYEDVFLDNRRLVVRVSKTGKRDTPIAKELLRLLKKSYRERGPVVPHVSDEEWATQADKIVEALRAALCRPDEPDRNGKASAPGIKQKYVKTEEGLREAGKRVAAITKELENAKLGAKKRAELEARLECEKAVPEKAYDGLPWLPAERVGWNAWRHTFASLRVQAGVSLDKVSSWMGRTHMPCARNTMRSLCRAARGMRILTNRWLAGKPGSGRFYRDDSRWRFRYFLAARMVSVAIFYPAIEIFDNVVSVFHCLLYCEVYPLLVAFSVLYIGFNSGNVLLHVIPVTPYGVLIF